MRALEAEHRILILDEPTTSLGAPERQRLYAIVDDLRRRGLAIIFISHDLDEILSLCDRVTVMRDGELVATKPVGDWTKQTLVGAMLGGAELRRTVARKPPTARARVGGEGVGHSGTCGRNLLHPAQRAKSSASRDLIGSGRTEILRALGGIDRGAEGQMEVEGRARPWPLSVPKPLTTVSRLRLRIAGDRALYLV